MLFVSTSFRGSYHSAGVLTEVCLEKSLCDDNYQVNESQFGKCKPSALILKITISIQLLGTSVNSSWNTIKTIWMFKLLLDGEMVLTTAKKF